MRQINPDATFDCLFIAQSLQKQSASVSPQETYLFAYLACLLWIYDEKPATDWGYSFVGTDLGAPFSQDIDYATKELVERGYFRKAHERIQMTEFAEKALQDLMQLSLNHGRIKCLQAACATTAAFSVGMVSNALSNEPDLRRSQALRSSRFFLEKPAQSQLYLQFNTLRQALPHDNVDLRVPAVLWLTALYSSNAKAAV
jgi:hypothetical protein